jgi:hypothetical protein
MPFSSFTTWYSLPPGPSTCASPLMLTGSRAYRALATTKLPTAHAQTSTAMDDVTRMVGTRNSSATPIQKREKRMAAPRAKPTVERAKTTNVRIGRNEKRSCATRKDYKGR